MKLKSFNADLKPQRTSHKISSHKNIINKLLVGNYVSTFKRSGMEFSDYRAYVSGDDANRIDWRASKRAQRLLIKETIEEKAVNVIFIVDVSDSMLCSSIKKLKCEYVAEIICNLAFSVQREGNAIGLIMFNEKAIVRIPPSIGVSQFYNMMKELGNPNNYGGKCDIKRSLKESLGTLKTPSLVVLLSDYLSLKEGWEDFLKIVSFRYSMLGIMVRDPRDRNLPKDAGYFVLEDPSTNEKIIVDTKEYYQKFHDFVAENEAGLEKTFKNAKSALLKLSTDEDFFNPLVKFLEKQTKVKVS